MYTHCPECGVAFRVTAEVLKQAAGKVRCGGCGIAFNALEHLSEQKPQASVQSEPEPQLPELTPDEAPELEADEPPKTISAEQSAALLKTLDQLAGSDIRIEDTGVEWRVLEEEDALGEDAKSESADAGTGEPDTGSMRFIVEEQSEEAEDGGDEVPDEMIEEMRFDDNTPLPDDFDFDAQPATTSEPEPVEPEAAPPPEDAQVDLALGEPDEWEDLLGEVDEPVAVGAAETEAGDEEPEPPGEEPIAVGKEESADDLVVLSEAAADQPPDMDTQFAIQAEAMGIDLSGMHDMSVTDQEEPEEEEIEVDRLETSIEEDLIAAAFEAEAAQAEAAEEEPELEHEELELEEEAEEPEPETEEEEPEPETEKEELELEEEEKEELEVGEEELGIEPAEVAAAVKHVVPEMTEEEMTFNRMIDEELLSVAVEDEEGFASTIVQVQPEEKVEDEIQENKEEPEPIEEKPMVETIIMEGEFVRDAIEEERLQAKKKEEAEKGLDDPGVSIPLQQTLSAKLRGGRRRTDPPGWGAIASVVALLLLLVAQFVHQSREAFATIPAFNQTLGPVYRMLGKPLTPAWDISGWRFEATKGSADEANELLTIYSRVGNKSDKALPYPLVHVSLTDRFEDIIGSRVLEPSEYLAEDADPRRLVAAGNTFNAVISIESPVPEATGFKLNVCYRLTSGQLRCAIEDFK